MHPIPAYNIPVWKFEQLKNENPQAYRGGFRKLIDGDRYQLLGQLRSDETLYVLLKSEDVYTLLQNEDMDRYNSDVREFKKIYQRLGFYAVTDEVLKKYFL